jgi:hypothetical protein
MYHGSDELLKQAACSQLLDSVALESAFSELRSRAVELALLCDPVLKSIAMSWERLLGRHQEVLEQRMADLGFESVPNEMMQFLLACLGSYHARRRKRDEISQQTEQVVFQTYSRRTGTQELRCECCGYHFRDNDMNSRRCALAQECNLLFSNFIDPRRAEDELKPISTPNTKDRYYTRLELDHVIPQATLGWGTSENIRILCRFCNAGKDLYAKPLEPISVILANSLAATYRDVGRMGQTLVTVVAALRANGGTCQLCRTTSNKAEITAMANNNNGTYGWFVPWRLRVACYDCKSYVLTSPRS